MAWVRVDDGFWDHPKVAAVGPLGWGVWLASIAWANRNLTDGFVPSAIADSLGGRSRIWVGDAPQRILVQRGDDAPPVPIDGDCVADILVAAGLWERVPGGYQIHDYLDYQPSRDDVLRRREASRRGGYASRSLARETDAPIPPEVPPEVPPQAAPEAAPEVAPEVNPNTQSQERETPSLRSGVSVGELTEPADDPPRAVMRAWNRAMVPEVWARPLALTPRRRRLIAARLRRWTVADLCLAVERVRASPWHCGDNETRWRATPEWLFADDGRLETWLATPPARAAPEPRGFGAIAAFLRSRTEGVAESGQRE